MRLPRWNWAASFALCRWAIQLEKVGRDRSKAPAALSPFLLSSGASFGDDAGLLLACDKGDIRRQRMLLGRRPHMHRVDGELLDPRLDDVGHHSLLVFGSLLRPPRIPTSLHILDKVEAARLLQAKARTECRADLPVRGSPSSMMASNAPPLSRSQRAVTAGSDWSPVSVRMPGSQPRRTLSCTHAASCSAIQISALGSSLGQSDADAPGS